MMGSGCRVGWAPGPGFGRPSNERDLKDPNPKSSCHEAADERAARRQARVRRFEALDLGAQALGVDAQLLGVARRHARLALELQRVEEDLCAHELRVRVADLPEKLLGGAVLHQLRGVLVHHLLGAGLRLGSLGTARARAATAGRSMDVEALDGADAARRRTRWPRLVQAALALVSALEDVLHGLHEPWQEPVGALLLGYRGARGSLQGAEAVEVPPHLANAVLEHAERLLVKRQRIHEQLPRRLAAAGGPGRALHIHHRAQQRVVRVAEVPDDAAVTDARHGEGELRVDLDEGQPVCYARHVCRALHARVRVTRNAARVRCRARWPGGRRGRRRRAIRARARPLLQAVGRQAARRLDDDEVIRVGRMGDGAAPAPVARGGARARVRARVSNGVRMLMLRVVRAGLLRMRVGHRPRVHRSR
mmetsp:Transcript_19939/g.60368  ORF Transcript_19939/g.60368 Transcript_19939/m.60368 type:complete len:421 (+) Transcript_19939:602-1864(+)